MKRISSILIAAFALLAALVIPATAFGHGAVRTVVPNKAVENPVGSGQYDLVADPANLQYVVSNHGHNKVMKETNGVTTGGLLAFGKLPSLWRKQASVTKADWFAQGGMGAQPHATCVGAPALTEEVVLSWQEADPFYSYIPWQKTSAGLGDVPSLWIPKVLAATGFDLNTLPDDPAAAATAASAACATAGGTYVPADTTTTTNSAFSSADILEATDPLNLQIDQLTTDKADALAAVTVAEQARDAALQGKADAEAAAAAAQNDAAAEKTRADAAEADAQAARDALNDRPVKVSVAGRKFSAGQIAVMVTGPVSKQATVQVSISNSKAKALGLKSSVIAKSGKSTGAQGAALITLNAGKALKKLKGSTKATITVEIDGAKASASGLIAR